MSTGAKRVQDVDALRGKTGAKLASEQMGSGETSLGDALWCCANLYSDIKLRLSHKRLMVFTCRDQPHGGDSGKDRQARTKAEDLKGTGECPTHTHPPAELNQIMFTLLNVLMGQPPLTRHL